MERVERRSDGKEAGGTFFERGLDHVAAGGATFGGAVVGFGLKMEGEGVGAGWIGREGKGREVGTGFGTWVAPIFSL